MNALNQNGRFAVIAGVLVIVVAVILLKTTGSPVPSSLGQGPLEQTTSRQIWSEQTSSGSEPMSSDRATTGPAETQETVAALPRIIEFGSDRCVPCKLMQPVLASLRSEYDGRLDVGFVDVVKDRVEGERNGIMMIPTQIFYGADGSELERHTGFISKEEILVKFHAHGVVLTTGR